MNDKESRKNKKYMFIKEAKPLVQLLEYAIMHESYLKNEPTN